uniref:Uncharacterized protein n=1 Tax=Acrobeloides nanus TaxID=290746 RepID=A0A914ELH6_9BILA
MFNCREKQATKILEDILAIIKEKDYEFLSISRLEELYKNDINNENALKFIIHEIAEVDDDYNYNLIDIGKVVEKLMGHDFTPFYNDNDFMKQYSNEIITKNTSSIDKSMHTVKFLVDNSKF